MEELFRMLLVRPPEAVDIEGVADDVLDLSSSSEFQDRLLAARSQKDRVRIATEFARGPGFIGSIADFPLGRPLVQTADRFVQGPHATQSTEEVLLITANALRTSLQAGALEFGDAQAARGWLNEIAASVDWKAIHGRLQDSILAIRDAPELHRKNIADLASALRAMKLVRALVTSAGETIGPARIANATLLYPRAREEEARPELPGEPEGEDSRTANAKQLKQLDQAMDLLMNLPRTTFAVDEQRIEEPQHGLPAAGARTTLATGRTIRLSRRAMVSSATVANLPEGTRQIVGTLGLDFRTNTYEEIVNGLQLKRRELGFDVGVPRNLTLIKGTKLPVQGFPTPFHDAVLDFIEQAQTLLYAPKAAPAGVGELLVIRQQLKRYEGGDLAHVENILQGESKERQHRRRRTTEETFVTEVETEKSEERETQTTSRYEMRAEIQTEISQELSLEAGVQVSANYGMVEVGTDTNFGYKNAKNETRQRAESMTQEIVERATARFSERVREERTRKLVEEVEEMNRHSVDATAAPGHIIGVYQWLNKIYEAQIYNYGLRVMYDFMVPEPAAYYIWSLSRQAEEAAPDLVPPPLFDIAPDQITESNYMALVAKYQASEVAPPPQRFMTVDVHKLGGPNPETGPMLAAEAAALPDGYEFVTYWAKVELTGKEGEDEEFSLVISDQFHEPGTVPIIFRGNSITGYSFFVHILCRRTAASVNQWRHNVWDALNQGHKGQVATYEEKIAALSTQAGIKIAGRNPFANRRIEQKELRKSCIALLTGLYPFWLDGILEFQNGPQLNLLAAKKQGPYVRFMEQAFEWENMTYIFYPYFWARGKKWLDLNAIDDVDPMFQDFLTAGYARVVVPVRPGFEPAVEHYRQTGQIWSGGDLPDIADPDYLPIVEELKERLKAPGTEQPVGEPWDVLVPTQLVKLRPDGSLPHWEKQEDGTWRET
jgi:hypothetical protein